MAAGFIAAPGTRLGPCTEACQHIDCASSRAESEQACRFCGKAIGYEVRFYRDPKSADPHVFVHARCLEDSVE